MAADETLTNLVDTREFGPHEASTDPARETSLRSVTNQLLADIRGLQFASREVSSVLEKNVEKHLESFGRFLGTLETRREVATAFETILSKDSASKTVSLPIPSERVGDFKRLMQELSVAQSAMPLSNRGLLLMLISKWDAYIGGVLRCIYSMKPEIIENSDRSISFSELREIGSIEVARDRIVEDEVGAVLRESHIAHFEYLEKKLGVKLRKGLEVWPTFVEITQRRHLIAHTDSRVTRQYLKVCADQKAEIGKDVQLGRRLGVNKTYFFSACDVLTELSVKMCQVLWRHLCLGGVKEAERHLTDTTFEMITAEQYPPAISILSFAMQPPMKFTSLRTKLICRLNLAQAYKWSGNAEQCAKTIAAEDWSAIDLRLAVAVLNDNFKHAAKLMRELGAGDEIGKDGYKDWPVFQEFRKSPEFNAAFKEIFSTNIEVKAVPADLLAAATKEIERTSDGAASGGPESPAKSKKRRGRKQVVN